MVVHLAEHRNSNYLAPDTRYIDMYLGGRPDQGSDQQVTVNLNSCGSDSYRTSRAVYRPIRP